MKDLEKLDADRLCEDENKRRCRQHSETYCTVHVRTYLSSVDSCHVPDGVWGILTVYPTHQTDESLGGWCWTKCGFVIRYKNTSNLEQYYIRGGPDHKELKNPQLTGVGKCELNSGMGEFKKVTTQESSPMKMTHIGNTSSLRW